MTACFADSFYFFAILNPRDESHPRATSLHAQLRRPIVTTTWVLTEVADGLAATKGRGLFPRLLAALRSDGRATIVPPSQSLFELAVELYVDRPDKEWSLTDCVSFVVVREHHLIDALTGDHHFEQAGFHAILR